MSRVVCLLCCLLLLVSACSVAIVRIRSSTRGSSSRLLLRLLHGSVLLPCGISGKMTIPLDTFTIIAMLSVSMLSLYVALPILLSAPLLVAMKPLTFDTFLAKPLFGYVTRLLSPSYSVVSCRWRWRSFQVGTCCWNITISIIIIINTPIYWAWVEGLAFCSVFCSTHATLGADKPALCSLILRSLHGWVYGDPLTVRLWIKLLQQGPTLVLICS